MTWTPAKIETLRTMWASGASVSRIAATLRTDERGVEGVLRRLGLLVAA